MIVLFGNCRQGVRVKNKLVGGLASISPIDFHLEVQPIFKKHCSPCHFPGGKMYAKMPFDEATTITSHSAGILRRIKDSVEIATIRNFLAASSVQQ